MKKASMVMIFILTISMLGIGIGIGAIMEDPSLSPVLTNWDNSTVTEFPPSPDIEITSATFEVNSTQYNQTWHGFGIEENYPPTLYNDSWLSYTMLGYMPSYTVNYGKILSPKYPYCNMTVTTDSFNIPSTLNISIDRVTITYNVRNETGWTHNRVNVYNDNGTISSISFNMTNYCSVLVWGHGSISYFNPGNLTSLIVPITLSNMVMWGQTDQIIEPSIEQRIEVFVKFLIFVAFIFSGIVAFVAIVIHSIDEIEAETPTEKTFQFSCSCGHINYIQGEPEKLVGCIFKCEKCGEKVLMREYGGASE